MNFMNKKIMILSSIAIFLALLSISSNIDFFDSATINNSNKNVNYDFENGSEIEEFEEIIDPKSSSLSQYTSLTTYGVNPVDSVAISSDGNYTAVGSNPSGKVYLFNKTSTTSMWEYTISGDGVRSVAISDDGFYIVAGTEFGDIYLFNKTSKEPLWKYSGPGCIYRVSMSSDGFYFATSNLNNRVYMFNRTSKVPMWTYDTGSDVYSVAISDNGKYLAAGTQSTGTYLFNTTNIDNPFIRNFNSGSTIMSVAISSDGSYIITAVMSGSVRLFHKSSSSYLWAHGGSDCWSVDISADGNYMVAARMGGQTCLYDRSGLIWSDVIIGNGWRATISEDGNYIAIGTITLNKVYYYHRAISEPYWNCSMSGEVRGVDLSADGKYLAAGSQGGMYRLFSSMNPKNFTLSTDADALDIDGSFNLNWTESNGADNYTIYESNAYITDLGAGVTELATDIVDLGYKVSNKLTGDYYYLIRSYKETGTCFTNCIHIKVLLPPGSFNLNTDADPIDTDGSFDLTWSTSTDAENYSVYVSNTTINQIDEDCIEIVSGLVAQYSYSISGLGSGDYYYAVVAFNLVGNETSNCVLVRVRIPPQPFSINTDADDPDIDGSFNITWSESIGADNYSVYISSSFITEIDTNCNELQNGIEILNYTVEGLTSGYHYFVVVAFNETGNATSDNCITVHVQIPPGPFNLGSDAGNPDYTGKFNLTWSKSNGAANYSVYTCNSTIYSTVQPYIILLQEGITILNYSKSTWKGIHYYIVVAYNDTGFTLSNCISVDVRIPPNPLLLTSNADPIDKDGSFLLSWNNSLGVDNYSVFISNSFITQIDGSCTEEASDLEVLTFPINNKASGNYYYVIVAYNIYGNEISNCINIIVERIPLPFTLSSEADDPDYSGAFYLNWTESLYARNYSIYHYNSTITEINDTITMIAEGLTNLSYWISGLESGNHYFIAVAYSMFDNVTSNCIEITVIIKKDVYSLPPASDDGDDGGGGEDEAIPFGHFYLLFALFSVIILLIIMRRRLFLKNK